MIGWAWITIGAVVLAVVIMQIAARFADMDDIKDSDVVVVKFGEKYKQWNAAFDAGYASALNKSLIVIQNEDHQHALKEIDAAASAVALDQMQVVRILKYVLEGTLK